MTALSADRDTPVLLSPLFSYPMTAAVKGYAGAMAVLDTAGNCKPGVTAAGLKAVGRFAALADNSLGSATDINAQVKSGIFRWVNGDTITKAHIGDTAYIVDDQTVSKAASGKSAAGIIVNVDDFGVWVDMSPAVALGSTGLVAANNLSDVGTVATARTNLALGTGDSPTWVGGTFTGAVTVGTTLGVTGNATLAGGAGGLTMVAAGSSLVCLDASATGFVMGSSGNPNMLQLDTQTGAEKVIVEGSTGGVAFHVDVGTALIDESLAVTLAATVGTTLGVTGVTTPIGGVAAATAFAARPGGVCHTGGVPAQVSTAGTDATPVATEIYMVEVFVPCNMLITGISMMNGSNSTDARHSALLYSDGSLVAASVTGAVASSGTDVYQKIPFTGGAITVLGPATYFVATIFAAGTSRYNAHTFGEFRAGKTTGQTYQAITSQTPPATFTTALGPIASLY